MNETLSFDEVLERDGQLVFTNKGVSMMPLLRADRDLMIIDRKGPEPCKVNDAVLFKRYSPSGKVAYVLHRVLRVNGDGTYYIVGDNCLEGETVQDENVIGVLSAVVRDGRTISVDDPLYQLYVRCWAARLPLRRVCAEPRIIASRCKHGLLRALGKE